MFLIRSSNLGQSQPQRSYKKGSYKKKRVYMLLFRSVVFDIRSVVCFIQSVVDVTSFDQLCFILDQLSLSSVLFNQLDM